MENIFKIMKDFGIEMPEDKKADFEKSVLENYKTVNDYNKQVESLNKANKTIKAKVVRHFIYTHLSPRIPACFSQHHNYLFFNSSR